jgi:hypothetical protein
MAEQSIEVSIVIPAYEEEKAIGMVIDAVTAAMDAARHRDGQPYHMRFCVDDGSQDNWRSWHAPKRPGVSAPPESWFWRCYKTGLSKHEANHRDDRRRWNLSGTAIRVAGTLPDYDQVVGARERKGHAPSVMTCQEH